MIFKLVVLLFTPLFSGLAIYLMPGTNRANYKMLLAFAGSYLFAITVIHILPELYSNSSGLHFIGLFVLAGFFLQQLLEYFTSGVEHGHVHQGDHSHGDHHHHTHHEGTSHRMSAIMLLLALCIHAFLEGGMLAESATGQGLYDSNAVLLGIALHRAPAAFALMTVLVSSLGSRGKALPHLLIFSVAAPIGLLVSSYLVRAEILSSSGLIYLYALVSGNFLHISTTIVFESSPGHRLEARKTFIALLGALTAVAVELIN